jgi:hypothetical protein
MKKLILSLVLLLGITLAYSQECVVTIQQINGDTIAVGMNSIRYIREVTGGTLLMESEGQGTYTTTMSFDNLNAAANGRYLKYTNASDNLVYGISVNHVRRILPGGVNQAVILTKNSNYSFLTLETFEVISIRGANCLSVGVSSGTLADSMVVIRDYVDANAGTTVGDVASIIQDTVTQNVYPRDTITNLFQDSILIYSLDGIETGRDTIRMPYLAEDIRVADAGNFFLTSPKNVETILQEVGDSLYQHLLRLSIVEATKPSDTEVQGWISDSLQVAFVRDTTTKLYQDSILRYYVNDVVVGQDTIVGVGGGSGSANSVYVISALSDTTTIVDEIQGDIAYVADTLMAIRGDTYWLPFNGGGSGGSGLNESQVAAIVSDSMTIVDGWISDSLQYALTQDTTTTLIQDSIFVYSVAGVETGRDTLAVGSGGLNESQVAAIVSDSMTIVDGWISDSLQYALTQDTTTTLIQDSIFVYSVAGVETGRDTLAVGSGGLNESQVAAIVSDSMTIVDGWISDSLQYALDRDTTSVLLQDSIFVRYVKNVEIDRDTVVSSATLVSDYIKVDSFPEISGMSAALNATIFSNREQAGYLVQADSISGYNVDNVAVHAVSGGYAILQTDGGVNVKHFGAKDTIPFQSAQNNPVISGYTPDDGHSSDVAIYKALQFAASIKNGSGSPYKRVIFEGQFLVQDSSFVVPPGVEVWMVGNSYVHANHNEPVFTFDSHFGTSHRVKVTHKFFSGSTTSGIDWFPVNPATTEEDSTSVGIKVLNSRRCTFYDISAISFNRGVFVNGVGTGAVENRFYLSDVRNCKWGLYIDGDAGGWGHQQYFEGGRIKLDGTINRNRSVDIDCGAIYTNGDNCTFNSINLEGSTHYKYAVLSNASSNKWFNCRFEGVGAGQIKFETNARGNEINGSYGFVNVNPWGLWPLFYSSDGVTQVQDGNGDNLRGRVIISDSNGYTINSGGSMELTGGINGTADDGSGENVTLKLQNGQVGSEAAKFLEIKNGRTDYSKTGLEVNTKQELKYWGSSATTGSGKNLKTEWEERGHSTTDKTYNIGEWYQRGDFVDVSGTSYLVARTFKAVDSATEISNNTLVVVNGATEPIIQFDNRGLYAKYIQGHELDGASYKTIPAFLDGFALAMDSGDRESVTGATTAYPRGKSGIDFENFTGSTQSVTLSTTDDLVSGHIFYIANNKVSTGDIIIDGNSTTRTLNGVDYTLKPNEVSIYVMFNHNGSRYYHEISRMTYNMGGTTANRPTLTSDDAGREYWDTDLNRYIYWDGTSWIDPSSSGGGSSVVTKVQGYSEILNATADSNIVFYVSENDALYDVQTDSLSGYNVDSIGVIPVSGGYAVLRELKDKRRVDVRKLGIYPDSTYTNADLQIVSDYPYGVSFPRDTFYFRNWQVQDKDDFDVYFNNTVIALPASTTINVQDITSTSNFDHPQLSIVNVKNIDIHGNLLIDHEINSPSFTKPSSGGATGAIDIVAGTDFSEYRDINISGITTRESYFVPIIIESPQAWIHYDSLAWKNVTIRDCHSDMSASFLSTRVVSNNIKVSDCTMIIDRDKSIFGVSDETKAFGFSLDVNSSAKVNLWIRDVYSKYGGTGFYQNIHNVNIDNLVSDKWGYYPLGNGSDGDIVTTTWKTANDPGDWNPLTMIEFAGGPALKIDNYYYKPDRVFAISNLETRNTNQHPGANAISLQVEAGNENLMVSDSYFDDDVKFSNPLVGDGLSRKAIFNSVVFNENSEVWVSWGTTFNNCFFRDTVSLASDGVQNLIDTTSTWKAGVLATTTGNAERVRFNDCTFTNRGLTSVAGRVEANNCKFEGYSEINYGGLLTNRAELIVRNSYGGRYRQSLAGTSDSLEIRFIGHDRLGINETTFNNLFNSPFSELTDCLIIDYDSTEVADLRLSINEELTNRTKLPNDITVETVNTVSQQGGPWGNVLDAEIGVNVASGAFVIETDIPFTAGAYFLMKVNFYRYYVTSQQYIGEIKAGAYLAAVPDFYNEQAVAYGSWGTDVTNRVRFAANADDEVVIIIGDVSDSYGSYACHFVFDELMYTDDNYNYDLSEWTVKSDTDLSEYTIKQTVNNLQIYVDDAAYDSSWDGNPHAATKDAIYDQIQTVLGGAADGDGIYDGDGTVPSDTDVTITDSLSIGGVRFIPGRKLEAVVSINGHLIPGGAGTFALTSDLHDAVTLAGEDYLSILGQEITANDIDLTDNVTGVLPEANIDATIARDSELPVISDAAYDASWNGNTTDGASKNAIYDQIQTVLGGAADGDGIYDGDGTAPAGTTVSITDSIRFDNTTLVIDGVTNRVGIRTGTLSEALNVAGTIAVTGGSITVSGTVDGRDVSTDGANLDELYDGSGSIATTTVTGSDKVLIHDTGSSDVLRTVTAQSIADLAGTPSLATTDLTDVTITSITTGEVLKWNGSAWINNTLTEAGISAAGHTHSGADITSGTVDEAYIDADIARDSELPVISDAAYDASWNGNTDGASKNAIYDQIQTVLGGAADGDGIYDGSGTTPTDTDVSITDSLSIGGVRFIPGRKMEQVVSINGLDIEDNLNTNSTNVVAAMNAAVLTGVTVNGADKVIIKDVSHSESLKTVTAQSIADLASSHDEVTLAGEDYLSILGQEITANEIDLTDNVTGVLPEANIDATIARDSELPSWYDDGTEVWTDKNAQVTDYGSKQAQTGLLQVSTNSVSGSVEPLVIYNSAGTPTLRALASGQFELKPNTSYWWKFYGNTMQVTNWSGTIQPMSIVAGDISMQYSRIRVANGSSSSPGMAFYNGAGTGFYYPAASTIGLALGNTEYAKFEQGITTFQNYVFNTNQTVGAGQDGYVLTYNDGSGEIELQAAGSGADNWGTQVVETDATLTGDGTTGTELSVANPFEDADESKLDGIEAGAEVNVNADWDAVSGDALILNKPTIPTARTDEEIMDVIGAMLTGGTQTLIALGYVDGSDVMNFVVENDLQFYDNSTTQFQGLGHTHSGNDITSGTVNEAYIDATIARDSELPTVSDDAYNATTWNGNTDVPTKNAIRDKFESLSGADGDGIYDGSGTVPTSTTVTVTDNLNFDANTLYIDATSNEIGIGTATPSQALDVAGNIALNGSIDVGSNVVVAGLVDGRDVADDGASLDELYDGEGGISTATVATNDKVLIHDAGSGDVLRTVTAQSIADLAGTGTDDQTASEVNITDSGGYYTGTEVETALSEIADTLGVHRTELNALSAPTVASLIPVVTDETISGSTKTLDCADKYSKVFDITNTGNYDCTLSIIKELDNATYVFHFHGMTAEVDITFPTDYKKADASTNLGTVTASSDIFVTCYDTGSQLNCSVVIDQ